MSSSAESKVFRPVNVGRHQFDHRVVLAPLTRYRSDSELVPTQRIVDYYAARASKGGLLISETTIVCPQSIHHRHQPAIFTEKQAQGWRKVVDAVHAKGGIFAMQIWHGGRLCQPSFNEHPLAKEHNVQVGESASAIAVTGKDIAYNMEFVDRVAPVEMTLERIEEFKQQVLHAADLAFNVANIDILEIHGAHGCLFDQFHNDGSNKRTDKYGGSVENRIRLTLEVIGLLTEKYGGDRVAIRLSPHDGVNSYLECTDSNPFELYKALYTELSKFNLAYLLVSEPRWDFTYRGDPAADGAYLWPVKAIDYRKYYTGPCIIGGGGFTPFNSENDVVDENRISDSEDDKKHRDTTYTMVAYGRWFISNPDLVFRVRNRLPFNRYDRATFYTAPPYDESSFDKGFNDYPTFEQCIEKYLNTEEKKYTLDEVINNKELIDKMVEASQGDPYGLVHCDKIGYPIEGQEEEVA